MAAAEQLDARLLASWPLPDHAQDQGKHGRGTVHVVGGATCTPGAVLLAGTSALRVGAGRLRITTVESTAVALGVALPEAMVVAAPADADGSLAPCDPGTAQATVLGPGLMGAGVGAVAARVAASVLADAEGGALVVDAVALTQLDGGRLPDRTVLTPNLGELRALAGRDGADAELAATVSERFGAAVATQGWVSAPGGRLWRHDGGSVGLGTSGSGDVLAGIVGGLLARGADAAQAACWATYLHSRAGELLATRQGALGYLARDLSQLLPEVLAETVA